MEKLVVDKSSLISVADAIRTKSGANKELEFPNEFINVIEGIQADSAELVSIIQEGINNSVANPNCLVFRGWQIPESYINLFDFSTVKQFVSTFYANKVLKNLSINTSSAEVINQICAACVELEIVVFSDTSKVVTWISPFNVCRKLKSIKTLDFSSVTTVTNPFLGCDVVEELLFVPETIKVSIAIPSAVLNDESIQSIIDGLATVETA